MTWISNRSNSVCCAVAIACLVCMASNAWSQSVLGRVDPNQSGVRDQGETVEVTLHLSREMPWRAFTMEAPRRLVVDVSEVVWPPNLRLESDVALSLGTGSFAPNWSRMVIELGAPMEIALAEMTPSPSGARLVVVLAPTSANTFAERSGAPDGSLVGTGKRIAADDRGAGRPPFRVMIDPGHGGNDPGDIADGVSEAELSMSIARNLAQALEAEGRFVVALTRAPGEAVPLTRRIRRAEAFEADVLVSLHADVPRSVGRGAEILAPVPGVNGTRISSIEGQDLSRTLVQAARESGITLTPSPWPMTAGQGDTASWVPSVQIDLAFLDKARNRDLDVPSGEQKLLIRGLVLGLQRWAQISAQRRDLAAR